MRILCVFGEHQYGDPSRGPSLESACFVPALRAEGHEVRLFDSWARTPGRSLLELNSRLLGEVEAWEPELLLSVVMDVEIWEETLLAIRSRGVRTVSWATDDTWKWRQVSRFIAAHYDGMVTTHEGAIADYNLIGVKAVMLSQWAAPEASCHSPRPANLCTHQVSFIGMAYGDRQRYVHALTDAGIPVACFGHRWAAGTVAQEEIPHLIGNSVISLNFSKGLYGGPNQTKARVFEVPGCGGFLLTEVSPGLERWYRIGEEIDVFHDRTSLVERVRYYLSHTARRDQCAYQAHLRTRQDHTYRQRMRAVVAFAESLPVPHPQVENFLQTCSRHQDRWYLRHLRFLLIAGCQLVWGPVRAPAYARRIAFEVSFRLSGRRTFTAAGWFGRMFP